MPTYLLQGRDVGLPQAQVLIHFEAGIPIGASDEQVNPSAVSRTKQVDPSEDRE